MQAAPAWSLSSFQYPDSTICSDTSKCSSSTKPGHDWHETTEVGQAAVPRTSCWVLQEESSRIQSRTRQSDVRAEKTDRCNSGVGLMV